jgi:DNA-binding response OmpR family regulator
VTDMADEGRKASILLVDDDKHLVEFLGDYLRFEGYEVVPAYSAEEALRKLEQGVPDVLVLDISMPGMGGMGFLKEFTKEDGKTKCPVLVLTARAKLEGFFDNLDIAGFLAKPCPGAKLVEEIEKILGSGGSTRHGGTQERKLVLLAEDSERKSDEISKALEQAQFSVSVARNGHEALERAAADSPVAILLNEDLRGMRGGAVVALLRVMPSTKDIPVVLYDESRKLRASENRQYLYQAPEGVRKLVVGSDPQALVRALKEVLG